MLVPYAMRSAVWGEVGLFTEGTQQRDFCPSTTSLTELLTTILERTVKSGRGFQLHHIGSGTAIPVRAMIVGSAAALSWWDSELCDCESRRNSNIQVTTRPISNDVTTLQGRSQANRRVVATKRERRQPPE